MSDQPYTLGTSVSAGDEPPTGDFGFLADPLALLTGEQERDLREDLAALARLRRETESSGASLPLA